MSLFFGRDVMVMPTGLGQPRVAEHELLQDFVGTEAVLSGRVDVAADVEAVLGDLVAGKASGYLLLGFQGADAALAEIIQANHRLRVIRAVRCQAGCE